MNKLILLDDNGRNYIVNNPKSFYQHLVDFHCTKKVPNFSIHEENGFYFTVTSELFKRVEDFVLNFKR